MLQLLKAEFEAGPPSVALSEFRCSMHLVSLYQFVDLALGSVEQIPSRSHLVQGRQEAAAETTFDISLLMLALGCEKLSQLLHFPPPKTLQWSPNDTVLAI